MEEEKLLDPKSRLDCEKVKTMLSIMYKATFQRKQAEAKEKQIMQLYTEKVKDFMLRAGKTSITFTPNIIAKDDNEKIVNDRLFTGVKKLMCKRIVHYKVLFDAQLLWDKLTLWQREKVIVKKYIINDMPALISMLKRYDVPAAEFKKYVVSEMEVNTPVLEQLEKLGELSKEDIKGTYKLTPIRDYLQITPDE